jgi:hypothetical protein
MMNNRSNVQGMVDWMKPKAPQAPRMSPAPRGPQQPRMPGPGMGRRPMPTGAGQPVPPWVRAKQLRDQLEPMVRDPRNGEMGLQRAKEIFDQEMAKSIQQFRAMTQQGGGGGGLGVMGRQ